VKAFTYNPSQDKMTIEFGTATGKPTIELGNFKIWLDKHGAIRVMEIESFTRELELFENTRGTINLQGIWKGINITEEDIQEAREDILQSLKERW
jgi:hypothetical protein